MASQTAELRLGDKTIELPVVVGSEGEHAIDITRLRAETGYITLDPGYANTGSCQSSITFIDGEAGILRYRGIPIEELAEHSSFLEVAHLLIHGHLPNAAEKEAFETPIQRHTMIHEDFRYFFRALPKDAHPGRLRRDDRRARDLLPRLPRPPRSAPGRGVRPPTPREAPDPRGIRLQALHWAADDVSPELPGLRRQFPTHDVRKPVRRVRGRPGHRASAGPAVDPARRPRAELLGQHRATLRLLDGEPLRGHLLGHQRALGAAPRWGQPGSDPDARRDRRPRPDG